MAQVVSAASPRPGERLVDQFGRWGFDLDGTIWRGSTLLPCAREVVDELRRLGAQVAFLTNNGSVSASMVAHRLGEAGIRVDPAEVVTSGRAVWRLLSDRGLAGAAAYVVGGAGLKEELAPLDLALLDDESGERADVVVVTRDEDLTYARLRTASRAVAKGALFVATNRDLRFPVEEGYWPGGGTIAAAVEAASGGVEPVVAGKPELPFLDEVRIALPGDAPAILVGDRPASDLESAKRLGWFGALVLTGVSSGAPATTASAHVVLGDLSELLSVTPAGPRGSK
ncbi:MAG: HAD-IIA family hydrolase [Acidimicrobiales bacterium]